MFDPARLQADFPILQNQVHGQPLVYLDNAATSQKPQVVLDAILEYYQTANANVHRGVHALADASTELFHSSRKEIAHFLGAQPQQLVVTRNTTEAINLIALGWAAERLSAADTIVATEMEHHSNLVPWQRLAKKLGAPFVCIAVDKDGRLDMEQAQQIFEQADSIGVLALSHVSNTLGTLNPIQELSRMLKSRHPRAVVIVDGAQAAPHLPVVFSETGADFYVVSAHKMLGPMGIGGMVVSESRLSELEPVLVGGGMIDEVTCQETSFASNLEERFTAGTPDVASLVGWAAAARYLQQLPMTAAAAHDHDLVTYTLEKLSQLPAVSLVGPLQPLSGQPLDRVGSVAFTYQGVHAHDVSQILDSVGVATRSGHHCTMPLHTKFNWPATTRVSFQVYNTQADIDQLLVGLTKVAAIFETK